MSDGTKIHKLITQWNPEKGLDTPLRWRKPRHVEVNMSDLFHEGVPDRFIAAVFATMRWAYWHQFLVLTKRPERMQELLSDPEFPLICEQEIGGSENLEWLRSIEREGKGPPDGWPLPNVWLGVSVEEQQRADERIPMLLQTPAAVRWVSAEPLLGPLDLRGIGIPQVVWTTEEGDDQWYPSPDDGLNWVVVGGESGPGARPCDLAWLRSLRDQCAAAGTKLFCKQLGSHWARGRSSDSKGGLMQDWPSDLQIREWPHA